MIAVVYIPTSLFTATSNNEDNRLGMNVDSQSLKSSSMLDGIKVLLLERNSIWVNVRCFVGGFSVLAKLSVARF